MRPIPPCAISRRHSASSSSVTLRSDMHKSFPGSGLSLITTLASRARNHDLQPGQKWTFGPAPRLRSRAGWEPELNQQVEAALRALVYPGPGHKSWDEVPDPEITDDGDIIVQVDATTICVPYM